MRIVSTIGEIETMSQSIAAAVEQQGAATASIVSNVVETTRAVRQASEHSNAVSADAGDVGTQAGAVLTAAQGLDEAVSQWRATVVRTIRTATPQADRRAAPRQDLAIPAWLHPQGRAETQVRLDNISTGGAQVTDAPKLQPGHALRLRLPGHTLSATALGTDPDGTLHLRFTEGTLTQEAIDRLASTARQAA